MIVICHPRQIGNVKQIKEYSNIINYCRDLYQNDKIQKTIRMDHIKMHYFTSHSILNPYAIIPKGSNFINELLKPHNR